MSEPGLQAFEPEFTGLVETEDEVHSLFNKSLDLASFGFGKVAKLCKQHAVELSGKFLAGRSSLPSPFHHDLS